MALIKDAILLANVKETSLVGLSVESSESCVILTQTNRRVSVYSLTDQKLVYDWLAKSGQELTCPAIKQPTAESQFSVIVNDKTLRSWSQNETSIDKGCKIQLVKPAFRLHSILQQLVILYRDGSLGIADRLLYEPAGNNEQRIVWSEQSSQYIIVVFRDKSRNKSEQYFARKYIINTAMDTVHVSDVQLHHPGKRNFPVSFCLQSNNSDLFLITLFNNGNFSHVNLMDTLSVTNSDILSPPPIKQSNRGLAVTALDSTQLAVVSQQNESNPALGIGIWDTKFGIFHSWSPLPDSKQSFGQVYYSSGRLLVVCSNGVYVYPVVCRTATLASCLGKTSHSHQLVQSASQLNSAHKKLTESLQQLAQPSMTPTYESFISTFATVGEWLSGSSDLSEKLKYQHLVNAVVLRCIAEKQFWPVNELLAFVTAHLVSTSICSSLVAALAAHEEVEALKTCLLHLDNIPEMALVTCLACFLSVDEGKLDECEIDLKESSDSELMQVFSAKKTYLVNLVLTSPFNDVFLLDSLHKLNYVQVLDLIRHLECLLRNISAVPLPALPGRWLTLPQVIDWLSLLIDAHYPQMALSSDTQLLHERLQSALQLQRSDVELMSEIDETLLSILRGKKHVEHNNIGSYCIRMLHID